MWEVLPLEKTNSKAEEGSRGSRCGKKGQEEVPGKEQKKDEVEEKTEEFVRAQEGEVESSLTSC